MDIFPKGRVALSVIFIPKCKEKLDASSNSIVGKRFFLSQIVGKPDLGSSLVASNLKRLKSAC